MNSLKKFYISFIFIILILSIIVFYYGATNDNGTVGSMYRNDYGRTGDYSPYDIKGTKNIKWIYNTKSKVDVSIIHNEDKLYFVDKNSTFYCLDAKTGKEIWKNEMKEYYSGSSAVVYKDMVIYNGGKLIAFNKYNGKLLWESNNGPYVYGEPIVVNDKIYVNTWPEIPEQQNYLYCFDVNTGKILWQHENGEGAACTESSAYSDGILYYGLVDGNFYAFNVNSKKVIWKINFDTYNFKIPMIFKDKIILFYSPKYSKTTYDFNLVILDKKNGSIIYENEIKGCAVNCCIKNYYLFMPKLNGEIDVCNLNNFELKTFKIFNKRLSNIIVTENFLYIKSLSNILKFSIVDYKLMWEFSIVNVMLENDPILINDILLLTTSKNQIYAIE